MSEQAEPIALQNRRHHSMLALVGYLSLVAIVLSPCACLDMFVGTKIFRQPMGVCLCSGMVCVLLGMVVPFFVPWPFGVTRIVLHPLGLARVPGCFYDHRTLANIVLRTTPDEDYDDEISTVTWVHIIPHWGIGFSVWLINADLNHLLTWANAYDISVDDRRERRNDEPTE